jgi:hypothetical protein
VTATLQTVTAPGPMQTAAPAMSGISAPAPVQVFTYRLTARAVAEWLATSRAERRATRGLVASFLLAGVMGLQFLTGRLPVPEGRIPALAEAATILILPVALALWTRRRALRRDAAEEMPEPVSVRLELWPDRVVEHRDDRAQPTVLRLRLLHGIAERRGHVLAHTDSARLIVPPEAFASSAARRDFLAHLTAKARQ